MPRFGSRDIDAGLNGVDGRRRLVAEARGWGPAASAGRCVVLEAANGWHTAEHGDTRELCVCGHAAREKDFIVDSLLCSLSCQGATTRQNMGRVASLAGFAA